MKFILSVAFFLCLTASVASAAPAPLIADISPLAMALHADPVVKAVMILLLGLSVWTWAIFIEKSLAMRSFNRQAELFLGRFRAAASLALATTHDVQAPMAHMLRAGLDEVKLSAADGLTRTAELRERVKERVENRVSLIEVGEVEQLNTSMAVLASVGSTSPFIGLFGTVWGIMHSFIGIAQTQTTNLAVVAPGIAEALMTTAFGLVAAIPAVVIYNKFVRDIIRFTGRLDAFKGEFAAVLSRELDRDAQSGGA